MREFTRKTNAFSRKVENHKEKTEMKRLLIAALSLLASGSALAESPFYLSATGGPLFPIVSELGETGEGETIKIDAETSTGYAGTLALGYAAPSGFRGELEVGYRKANLRYMKGLQFDLPDTGTISLPLAFPVSGDMSALSLMLNGLYVFEAGEARPYLGAGIGFARHEVESQAREFDGQAVVVESTSSDDTVMAYQGMIGLLIPVNDNVDARLGYRYFDTATADFNGADFHYGGAHSIDIGVVVQF